MIMHNDDMITFLIIFLTSGMLHQAPLDQHNHHHDKGPKLLGARAAESAQDSDGRETISHHT